MDALDELNKILGRWLRWLRFRRSVHWSLHGLILGMTAGLLAGTALTLQNRLVRTEFTGLFFLAAVAGFLLAALIAGLWPVSRQQASRYFDRQFRLEERVSTALELGDRLKAGSPLSIEMSQKQLADAYAAAIPVQPQRLLPIQLRPFELGLAAVFCLCALLFANWSQSHFIRTAQARRVKQAIAAEAKNVGDLRSRIEEIQSQKLTPEQVQALTSPLEEAQERLKSAETLEQAAAALERAESSLQDLAPAKTQQQAQALRETGQALGQNEGSPLQSFGKQLAAGNFEGAAATLQDIQTSELNPEGREALSQQLDQAAQSLQQSDPQTATQLQSASQAIQAGDSQTAASALQSAAQNLNAFGHQQAQAQAAQQAAGQLSQSQQQLLAQGSPNTSPGTAAGQNAQNSSNQASGDEAAAGGPSGAGGASENGAAQASSDQQAAGGAGRGESRGSEAAGSQAGSQPIDQNNGPGDGGVSQYEEIYAPQHLGGSGGVDAPLPEGQNSQPGDQILGQSPSSPGSQEQSSVPYIQVLPSYQDAYRQAIEGDQVPLHLRALVREYFSALQP